MVRIVCKRKSNNGTCQINPVTYFLDQKASFQYDEIIEKSPEDDTDIEEHNYITLGKAETAPFLFVYQNGWQKRLFARYGSELTLLDAIYCTIRYALPLFLLVVKANTDYQIVAVFVTENETEGSMEDALSIIKTWNETVNPMCGMTDYCTMEFKAIEKCLKVDVSYYQLLLSNFRQYI